MKTVTLLVTGGIGSGKSAVAACLERNGIPVYDSDSRTKSLYDSDEELRGKLEELLGTALRTEDGHFDRKRFASLIFSDRCLLEEVERIVHPAVLEDFRLWREEALTRSDIVAMESAIALDKPLFRGVYDVVVMVDASMELRVERACRRDSSDPAAVMERIRCQNTDFTGADYIIENNGSLSCLDGAVLRVVGSIREKWLQKN